MKPFIPVLFIKSLLLIHSEINRMTFLLFFVPDSSPFSLKSAKYPCFFIYTFFLARYTYFISI